MSELDIKMLQLKRQNLTTSNSHEYLPCEDPVFYDSIGRQDVYAINVDIQPLRVGIKRRHHDRLALVCVQQVVPETLGIRSSEVEVVIPPRINDGVEGADPLLTGVTMAPSMVLRAIDQIHVPPREECHGRNSSGLRVRVHALHDHHYVVETGALVCLPTAHPDTVIVPSVDSCPEKKLYLLWTRKV